MITEMITAYKESREEDKEYRKELREIDLRSRYVKLQNEAAKTVADMKKLNVDAAAIKELLQKPW